jgi:NAD(P)-dependent dehydrogenase (short-subunit alcohol dehydrogenase family)
MPMPSMAGRLALVTGATGGIGGAVAAALAREGARVVVVGRTQARAGNAFRDLRAAVPSAELEALACDLSSQASIRSAVSGFLARRDALDVLVNAAGVFRRERHVTHEGLELTFATNVLGYFLMTSLLADALRRAAAVGTSRVVNLASKYGSGPFTTRLDFDDLQTSKGRCSVLARPRRRCSPGSS